MLYKLDFKISLLLSFFKYWPNLASFSIKIVLLRNTMANYSRRFDYQWKSKDGVLGIRTWDRRMVGAD